MRLRFGADFWAIFLNIIDIQNRISQKESTHSNNHFKPILGGVGYGEKLKN